MGVLFIVAYLVDNKNFLSSTKLKPYIYSLSFAIYCTAWTYYGSVGKAVSSGFLFLAVYLGPTIIIFLWPVILKKMIRIKNIFKITSLADLITIRYEKSAFIGAFVSLGALFGTIPYISIQLKALITSISILEDRSVELSYTQNLISQNVGILIVILMILFTILFGIRKLDPTERHEGMMVIVAIESLVKLFAIIAIGVFVVFFVTDGIFDILSQSQKQNFFNSIAIEKGGEGYANWTSVLILSMFAIMFLPRQFHVSVVENYSEKHIYTVMWLLPSYLLLITFFTIPIAMGGSLLNPNTELIDFYVLMIPYEQNAPYLSMVAFIGGFSASTSMIMVTSMTMAIMISNYLFLPVIEFYKPLKFLKKKVLFLRWVIVALFISMGYIFYVAIAKDNLIVNIGLISFTAILQFVPTIIGGLFWKESTKNAALWGMSLGFILWFYLLIIPQFVQIGLIDSKILSEGLFGIWLLKPNAFLGLTDFSSIPHAVFWSMFFNIVAFILCSLLEKKSNQDIELASRFVDVLATQKSYIFKDDLRKSINVKYKCQLFEEVLNSYFSTNKTRAIIDKVTSIYLNVNQELISVVEYSKLFAAIEKELSGSIGSASAHRALSRLFTKEESNELSNIYADMLTKMNITPEQLNEKMDYFQEREKLLEEHSKELTKKVEDRTKDLLEQKNIFETLFQESSYCISLIKNGRFIDCNSSVLKMLKLQTKEEFLKFKPHELSPKYQPDGELSKAKEKSLLAECMKKGQLEFEWLHVKSDGEVF